MRECNKIVTEKSIMSLVDLDPSDLKPHQKVEVHERYLHAKYIRDRKNIEGAMRNCNKIVTEKSITVKPFIFDSTKFRHFYKNDDFVST